MRGTAGAIFILALSILGLGLGPYCTGKVAAVTGSLRVGMLSMIAVTPLGRSESLRILGRFGRGLPENRAEILSAGGSVDTMRMRYASCRAGARPGVAARSPC